MLRVIISDESGLEYSHSHHYNGNSNRYYTIIKGKKPLLIESLSNHNRIISCYNQINDFLNGECINYTSSKYILVQDMLRLTYNSNFNIRLKK